MIITSYNIFQKVTFQEKDISNQYQRAYNADKYYLESNNQTIKKDDYEKVIERINLEKYAIDNNIKYNILLNSQNKNVIIPQDARILLMKVFDNFEILIIFLIIYLSCTTISEEYYTGTIKNVLTKPYTRIKILCSKILINFTIIAIAVCILVLFQYLIGGILFGFESYSLEAIRYNSFSQNIETINLDQYIYVIILTKILMYVIFSSFSLLFGIITNNMALNVLISLGIYFLSAFGNFTNDISKYIFIYNWDISKYLFGSRLLLNKAIIISSMSLLIIIFMVTIIFKNKDVKNM